MLEGWNREDACQVIQAVEGFVRGMLSIVLFAIRVGEIIRVDVSCKGASNRFGWRRASVIAR